MTIKIDGNNIYSSSVKKQKDRNDLKQQEVCTSVPKFELSGSNISFGAIYPIRNKKVNIEQEKNKLLRQLDDALSSEVPEFDEDEIIAKVQQNILNQLRADKKKKREIAAEIERVTKDQKMNHQQRVNILYSLKKDVERLGKLKYPKHLIPKLNPDAEKIDFLLLHKFKTAILEDNFDLASVYKAHFADLKKITTIKALNKKYPKIKTPIPPEKVIAKKVVNILTKDVYVRLEDLMQAGNEEEAASFINDISNKYCEEIAQKFNLDSTELSNKLVIPVGEAIIESFMFLKTHNQISSVPQSRKSTDPAITQNDINLLFVDLDKFVLSVVRQHYLDGKKINDIVYEENGVKINTGSLKEVDYKFEKFSEKFKKIINDAMAVKTAQRDYFWFNESELKKQLDKLSSKSFSQNDEILERLIAFDQCDFTNEDKEYLIKFLEILDKVQDQELSLNEAIEIIKTENIRPLGTEKLNEIKMKEMVERLKSEQEKKEQLHNLKEKFDNAINILYLNNMNSTAQVCFKYRPQSLDEKEIEKANFVINTILENRTEDGLNRAKIESTIARKDTYEYYVENDVDKTHLQQAKEYAQNKESSDYIDSVGQYLINAEIVENYPDSTSIYKQEELLIKLMERFGSEPDKVVEYLCKFDDYNDLNQDEKSHISNYIGMFDQKDAGNKIILKYIIENDYVPIDTIVNVKSHGHSNEDVEATFAAKAKQEILDRYNFPNCIEFLVGFEDAMTTFATENGSSGIKKLTRNNKGNKYKAEVKLLGHDDRLLTTGNDYYFDIYSRTGLH